MTEKIEFSQHSYY